MADCIQLGGKVRRYIECGTIASGRDRPDYQRKHTGTVVWMHPK